MVFLSHISGCFQSERACSFLGSPRGQSYVMSHSSASRYTAGSAGRGSKGTLVKSNLTSRHDDDWTVPFRCRFYDTGTGSGLDRVGGLDSTKEWRNPRRSRSNGTSDDQRSLII